MAVKTLQIGDGTDSNHGIRAKLAAGDRDLRYNATTSKWEATNDGSTFFDLSGGIPFPSNVQTTEDANRIIPVDLDNPDIVWDLPRFLQLAQNTSWYAALGAPPTHGFIFTNGATTELTWWDRLQDQAYITFETNTSDMLEIGGGLTNLCFLDGRIYVGTGSNGMFVVDLLKDTGYHYGTVGFQQYKGDISERNDAKGFVNYNGTIAIVHDGCHTPVAYRDPNGLVDGLGRSKQWWAVSTTGGVSVYNPEDNAIYDAVLYAVQGLAIAKDGTLVWQGNGNGTLDLQHSITKNTADSVGVDVQYYLTASAAPYTSGNYSTATTANSLAILSGRSVAQQGANVIVSGIHTAGGGGNARDGLNIIHENKQTKADGGAIFIANGYNGPYMKGEVKGAWPLQGDALDVAKHDHDLTNNNTVTFDASGVYGASAANFVAASSMYLSLADHADFTFTTAFSVSCWFYRDIDSGGGEDLVAKWDDTTGTDKVFTLAIGSGDTVEFSTYTSSSVGSVGPAIQTGYWYHAVGTYDGTTQKLYLNGILVDSDAQSGNLQDGAGALTIGCRMNAGSPTKFFDGRIQNVCITAAVLTQREIEYDYRRGMASLSSSVDAGDNLEASDIDAVRVDELGGYISVCAGDVGHILDSGGIPIVEDAAPAGTLRDIAVISMPGSATPHYAMGTTSRLELVQGVVETREQRNSGGSIAPRTIHGPTKYLGDHSLKAYDAIVDINGNGDYLQIDDAIEAGAKNIYVREGTYEGFAIVAANADVSITGANWDTIIDGGTTYYGINNYAPNLLVKNLTVKTTAGGGQPYDAILANTGADNTHIINVRIAASDDRGIWLAAPECLVEGCLIQTTDSNGIIVDNPRCRVINNHIENAASGEDLTVGSQGDNFLIAGNHIEGGMGIHADAENGLCVGNLVGDGLTDNSGTSTVANNELY